MVMSVKCGSIFISFAGAATLTAVRDCRQFAKKELDAHTRSAQWVFRTPTPSLLVPQLQNHKNTVQTCTRLIRRTNSLFLVVQPSDLDVIFSITNSAIVIVNIRECFLSSSACSR